MNPRDFLEHLTGLPLYQGQIVRCQSLPPREPNYGRLKKSLHPRLELALEKLGLLPLYSHQAEAINHILEGKNVIISTPSASGKTLCYNLPVLNAVLEEGSRALYLFPTKALAHDQLRALGELVTAGELRVRYASFDGDTPSHERREIRTKAQVVLSNPDMLHLGILPNHASWSAFLSRLRFVVIDEAHAYRGVFGSHVANVIRRLRRLCQHYGSAPQFICCSATIANPKEHAENLVGLEFEAVTRDGSPFGGKEFVLWNPPLLDPARSLRRSANTEATKLLAELMRSGIRSLAFARTRRLVELIYLYVQRELAGEGDLAWRIKPYRAGYLPEERRQIEGELLEGKLLAAVATTALELGVDIGDLEATVLVGYPGSISSTWQQAGRSGRRGKTSLSFLIGSESPLDQYFMQHPDSFFEKEFEHALISPSNPHILGPHLLCAAWEIPLSRRDIKFLGDFEEVCERLESEGLLRQRAGRWYPAPGVTYPAQEVNLRSVSAQNYLLVEEDTGQILETIEETVAFSQIHPGAIYLHQGESYLVTELDIASRTAYVSRREVDYYTQAKELTDLRVLRLKAGKMAGRGKAYLGEVEVTNHVVGFKKKRIFSEEVIGEEPLDLPPQQFMTVALWFDLAPGTEEQLMREGLDLAGGLHAAEHAAIALLPLFALCDRNDIGGVSTPFHPDTGKPQVFIYDAHPGGVGLAEKGFELVEELWRATLRLISECPCEEGCPSCVQSPKCGNNNQPLDKRAAQLIFQRLLEGASEPRPIS